MKGIKNGKVYFEGKFIEGYVVLYEQSIARIVAYTTVNEDEIEWLNAKGAYVIPGFIDVHIHGYQGKDVMDGDVESLKVIMKGIAKNGVTSFLATTMTMSLDKIEQAIEAVEQMMDQQVEGAQIIGVHMEGPFINSDYKGAQLEEAIIIPDNAFVNKHKDMIKVMTVAPEIEGALELISTYKDEINFSLGHTGADYVRATKAIELGAKSVTHLFNAMTGLHHRAPGVVGTAFTTACYSELIADNIHVNPYLYEIIAKVKGLDKLLLITDCMKGGGLDDDIYDLGGQEVMVEKGKCTLKDGTIAGSVLKLNEALKNFEKQVSYTLEQLLPLVTINQAKYLKIEAEKGSLAVGKDADIVIMDKAFNIKTTIVKGNKVYEASV